MKRRTMVKGLAAAAAVPAATGAQSAFAADRSAGGQASPASSAGADPLRFDPDAYTELTTTISTDAGDKEVVYRFWKAVTYVAAPVDATYQSLNVSVPVRIDGSAVDATRAPILFANSVGGYMPSSVATATGVGAGGTGGGPGGAGAPTPQPSGSASSGTASGSNATVNAGAQVNLPQLALAAGYVVVEPGARGRTLVDSSGRYYGTAPAAIVDLKAAVRYVRHNRGRIPGDTDRIVSSGVSAGGALSALLGASGDSPLYDGHLRELGAAEASDAVFASADWCPITDLEHADMAYEWNWGGNTLSSGSLVDRTVSAELASAYTRYLATLDLHADGFGRLSTRNLGDYLLRTHLQPSATRYLAALSDADRSAYLAQNTFLTWSAGKATFSWDDFLAHVGARKKDAPAFDAFDLSAGENNEFGAGTTEARHFTLYSLRHATGDATARLDTDLPGTLDLMNPMYFLKRRNPGRARHWWIRVGTKDTDTALTVVGNLTVSLENLGDQVDTRYYWDAGHGANEDPAAFIDWIGQITGHRR